MIEEIIFWVFIYLSGGVLSCIMIFDEDGFNTKQKFGVFSLWPLFVVKVLYVLLLVLPIKYLRKNFGTVKNGLAKWWVVPYTIVSVPFEGFKLLFKKWEV